MTDGQTPDTASDDALAARLEAMRQRRAANARTDHRTGATRRRHPARRSRIGAAILGIVATAAITTALDQAAGAANADIESTRDGGGAVAAGQPFVIVVHHGNGSVDSRTVTLVPNPVVRPAAPRSSGPTARTHGSR